MNPNCDILQQILERDIENIYENLRNILLNKIPKQFQSVAINYLKANEPKWINIINEKIETIVAFSFPTPETSLEEGMENANVLVNDFINGWLVENVGMPENLISIATQLLFGI